MSFDLPPVTRNLLIANVAVFLLQQVMGQMMLMNFALWPLGSGLFGVWQLVTSAFMHGSITHILFNMIALYMFGGTIERTFGPRNFTIYYFVCAIVASLLQLAVLWFFPPAQYGPTLGASGAIFGLLLAFGMLYPHEKVFLIFLPIPMPAWLFVRGSGADHGRDRHRAGRRPFRTPGRDARWHRDDPVLAWPSAVEAETAAAALNERAA
jgi:membrane associated rhomboid family serine protease